MGYRLEVACRRGDAAAMLDGFKRLSAARALGLPTLHVRIIELSEPSAIAAVMSLHRAGRGLSDLEQALCVRALVNEHGLTQVAVGDLLDKHPDITAVRLLEQLRAARLCGRLHPRQGAPARPPLAAAGSCG